MFKRFSQRLAILAVVALAVAGFVFPDVTHAAAPTGSSATMTTSTATTVNLNVTGTDFFVFENSSTTTANATDTAKITYKGASSTAAVINSTTSMTITFPISIGTDKSGSLVLAAGTVKDATSTSNATITIVNGSITDNAKPIIRTVTIYDAASADGKIDKIAYNWSEPIDTDNSAAPVAADLPTTLLPDGSTADFTSATISDPTGSTSTITVTGVTGQVTANTAAASTAISGDLSALWVDGAANTPHATIATASESIVDEAAPAVLTVSPANGAEQQSRGAEPTITFSEAMDTGSATFSTNPSLTYSQTWSNSDKTVTFSHTDAYDERIDVYASLTAGNAAAGTVVTAQSLPYNFIFSTVGSSNGGGGSSHSSGGGSSSNNDDDADTGTTTPAPTTTEAQLAALIAQLQALQAQAGVTVSTGSFTRDLTLGSTGEDVRALQAYLNAHGFAVASTGPGSKGSETTTFGSLTQAALAKWQASVGISPAAGYFGPKTRAYVASH